MKYILFLFSVLFLFSCQTGGKSVSEHSVHGKWTVSQIKVNNETQNADVAMQFKSMADMGMNVEVEFLPNGAMTFGMMMLQVKGKYEVKGDELTFKIDAESLPKEAQEAARKNENNTTLNIEKIDSQTLHLNFPDHSGFIELKRKG